MFERAHHARIATLLEALDAEQLQSVGCLFGGGTAIVLTHGEYRESLDIDFLVSNLEGYRALRQRLTSEDGIRSIARTGTALKAVRDIRADQYGIRTMLDAGGFNIKFEIVFESRIALEPPTAKDRICGVATLTELDMATTKLLANSDRWADDAVFSRDLIDLAMLDARAPVRRAALDKARTAYGDAIRRDVDRAIARLRERTGRLEECMAALKIEGVPKAVLWKRIKKWLERR